MSGCLCKHLSGCLCTHLSDCLCVLSAGDVKVSNKRKVICSLVYLVTSIGENWRGGGEGGRGEGDRGEGYKIWGRRDAR